VIFMITAPMMQGGIDITLPSTEAKPIESKDGLTVSVNKARQIFVGEERYASLAEFRIVLKSLPKNRTRNGVYLRADQNVDWGLIAQVMAAMYAAGITDVGLITQPEEIK